MRVSEIVALDVVVAVLVGARVVVLGTLFSVELTAPLVELLDAVVVPLPLVVPETLLVVPLWLVELRVVETRVVDVRVLIGT